MPILLLVPLFLFIFLVVWAADSQAQRENPYPRLERTVDIAKGLLRKPKDD